VHYQTGVVKCGGRTIEGAPISWSVFYLFIYLFLFILYHVFIVTAQELACSASYGVNKTSISKNQKTNEIIKSSPTCVKYSKHHHLTANK